jgi:hypothetical protein
MATLDRLLSEVRSAFGSRTRVWLTELGYQTNPPDRVLGVSWSKQARFLAEAQWRAYLAARVDVLIQYLLRDEPRLAAWQSGLETVAGKAKPALAAFSLPLAQAGRKGATTTIWGQVRPGTGARRYVLQRYVDGRWRTLVGGRTTSRGFVMRSVRATEGTILRLFDPATGRSGASILVR